VTRGEAKLVSPDFSRRLAESMVGFPLLLIPLAVYNIIVFLMTGVSFSETLLTLPLPSGAGWPVTLSDILLTLGVFLLLLEVIKGARPGSKFLIDHLLSLIVSGCAAAEFLLWPRFASSTFFLLTLLAIVDFLSGLALRTRRRMPAFAANGDYRVAPAAQSGHQVRHEESVPVASQAPAATHAVPSSPAVTASGFEASDGPPQPPETSH
jgi:hypothetical protein